MGCDPFLGVDDGASKDASVSRAGVNDLFLHAASPFNSFSITARIWWTFVVMI